MTMAPPPALLLPLNALTLLFLLGPTHGQNEVAKDISFQLSGTYVTPSGAHAHLVARAQGLPALGEFTVDGDNDGAPIHDGFATTHVRYTKYGHGEHDTGAPGLCPGEPTGTECGWTIGCPILAGHSQPISCLAPSPNHGCLPGTGKGVPQCRWGNATAAEKYCSEWPDCLGFHCLVEFQTEPSGCGDCPQPAGSWCKCREIVSCQARGNGTKLIGGGSGDQQDYAYVKAGNATGWLQLSPLLSATVAARASESEGCHLKAGEPAPYKALCKAQQTRAACLVLNESCVWTAAPAPPPPPPAPASARNFVFSMASGNLTYTDTSWVASSTIPGGAAPATPTAARGAIAAKITAPFACLRRQAPSAPVEPCLPTCRLRSVMPGSTCLMPPVEPSGPTARPTGSTHVAAIWASPGLRVAAKVVAFAASAQLYQLVPALRT
eukprot:SAG31_NODE_3147_length_4620_cov_1.523114_2_plen_437_part_00